MTTRGRKLEVAVTGDNANLRKSLDSARQGIRGFVRDGEAMASKLGGAFSRVSGLLGALGISASVAGLVASVRGAINDLDALGKSATRSGISTEAFAALDTAAKLADVSTTQLASSLRFLSKELPKVEDDLRSLGIETRNVDGSFRKVDGVLEDLSKLLLALPEGPEQSGLAMKFLGRQGAELLPLLQDLAQNGMQGLEDRARALGVVMDEETTRRAAEFNDTLTEVQIGAAGLSQQLAAELLPDLIGLAKGLRDATQQGDLAKGIAIQLRTEWLSLAAAGREVKAAIAFVGAIGTGATQSIRNALSTASFGAIDAATPEAMAAQSAALTEAASDYKAAVADLNDARTNALMAGAQFYGPDELNAQIEQQRKLQAIEDERAKKLTEFQERIQAILAGGSGSSTGKAKAEVDALTPALQRLNDATQGLAAQAGGPATAAWESYRMAVQRVSQAGAAAIKAGGDEVMIQKQVAIAIQYAAKIRDEALAKSRAATDAWLAKLDELQAELSGPVHQVLLAYARDVREAAQAMEDGLIDEATFQRLVAAWTELRDRSIAAIREPMTAAEEMQLGIANAGVNALAGFFQSIGDSSMSAKEKVAEFVRGFASAVASMIARALALAAVLRILEAIAPGTAAALRLSSGIKEGSYFHQGGIVGMGRGTRRTLHPLMGMLAGAGAFQRFHDGGFPGLKANEVPAVLEKGEEVLARNDARNSMNGGGLERPAPGYRILNIFDPSFITSQMDSAEGERVIFNMIGRNPGRVNQLLGR